VTYTVTVSAMLSKTFALGRAWIEAYVLGAWFLVCGSAESQCETLKRWDLMGGP
jgi:hypothetical protein